MRAFCILVLRKVVLQTPEHEISHFCPIEIVGGLIKRKGNDEKNLRQNLPTPREPHQFNILFFF